MLLPGVSETIGYADKSRRAAMDGSAHDDLFLETVGISAVERQAVQARQRNGRGNIDPVVSYLIGATCGNAYRHLRGKLETYPIPKFRREGATSKAMLDLGCNWGRWCFAAARSGFNAIGIDPQLGAVLAAKRVSQQLGIECSFVCADARHLPFRRGVFDLVFSYSVLQHLSEENVKKVVQQAAEVLDEEGELLVQMPNRLGIVCFLQQLRRHFRTPVEFEVRYWALRRLAEVFGTQFASISFEVDCFFGIGLQSADEKVMRLPGKAAVRSSEWLRKKARRLPGLVSLADSVYVRCEGQIRKPALPLAKENQRPGTIAQQ